MTSKPPTQEAPPTPKGAEPIGRRAGSADGRRSEAGEGARPGPSWYDNLAVELDPERMEESLRALGEKLRWAWDQGRYTRVRIKYKGRQVLPDIPLGALVATEVATLWWMGPLRVLVMNLGVKTFVEVELVHKAGEKVREGQELFMDGEVGAAEAAYREALRMRPGDPSALYNLGVLQKVTGHRDAARVSFRAAMDKPEHPDARRAEEALGRLGG